MKTTSLKEIEAHLLQIGLMRGMNVSIHHISEDIDLGDLIAERELVVSNNDTGLTLYRKTQSEGLELLLSVIKELLSGATLDARKQDVSKRVLYTHKDAANSKINWKASAKDVRNFIRAGAYYPLKSPTYTASVFDEYHGEILLLSASVENFSGVPGTILDVTDNKPLVGCGHQSVKITRFVSVLGEKIDWKKVSLAP